ncbi:amidohydrolase [Actinoplanes sp. NPDC049596]|uniref:amidohydrolase n=1 Tax=unclassified Actinoplanes TaxID=2626549 RepID=UPI0034157FCA
MHADIVVRGPIYTMDPAAPWAEAMAVTGGRITAVGDAAAVRPLAGPGTLIVEAGDGMVMPGIVDAHNHVSTGGQQAAWELSLPPVLSLRELLDGVGATARAAAAGDWVIGGAVGSDLFNGIGTAENLRALDAVSHGHPVMLRDVSTHHRWVNSRALEILGITAATPDPPGGSYLRDDDGRPVGVLFEQASQFAEQTARESIPDQRERDLTSARTALRLLNSYGVTAVQDAGTMGPWLDTFHSLDERGELTAWLVASMPNIHYMVASAVFPELAPYAATLRSRHLRPDFVKILLDGIPMSRSAAMLHPYAGEADFRGASLYDMPSLVAVLQDAVDRGLHVKAHATGDFTVRQVLDAVQVIRDRGHHDAIFHVAHPEFVDPADIRRFRELNVVADASPTLWFPNPINDVIRQQVGDRYMSRIWPLRELHEAGVTIAAGTDWPSAVERPDPWLAIETMVTRRHPGALVRGALAPEQALDLPTALTAHTSAAAAAIGLGGETGRLKTGLSADFVVLDRRLLDIPINQVSRTEVRQTWFTGRLVHG